MKRAFAIGGALATLAIGGLAAVQWTRVPGDAPRTANVGSETAVLPTPRPTEDGEPSKEDCLAAVEKVRTLASALPADHPSRYIAERYLHQSMAESGNGEHEDCVEWAERAEEEVRGLRHAEKLKVLQSDEVPASSAPSVSDSGAKSGHNKSGHTKRRH